MFRLKDKFHKHYGMIKLLFILGVITLKINISEMIKLVKP